MTRIFLIVIAFSILMSCEKVIDLDLKDSESKFVIEGHITDEPGPYYVKLSKSVPFNQSSIYPAITNALVEIEDSEGTTETLSHIGGGVYETSSMQGVPGRTYHLKVEADGETYTASSTMMEAVPLDSIDITYLTFGTKEIILLVPVYTDPESPGNHYKFDLTVNGVKDKSYLVWSDAANNGEVNKRPLRTINLDIESGDTASIELQSINPFDYRYYFTLSQGARGPGASTTPANPESNVSNGGIGLFSAYAVSRKTVVIP